MSHYLIENTERNRKLIFEKKDVLSVSGEFGVVNQIEFQGRSFAGESVAEYHVVHTGDIVYTKSPLKANPYGIIKTNNGVPGIVSTLYAVYHPLSTVASKYVEYYFCNDLRLNKFLKPLVNIGAKHDMKVNNEFVLTGDVCFPSLPEQQRIVDFLSVLDERISKQRSVVENLKKYKRGVSNRVFNEVHADKDSTIIGFADAFLLLQNNTFSRDCLTIEETGIHNIHYGDILVKYGSVVDPSIDVVPYIREGVDVSKYGTNSYLKNGDVVFADTAEDYAVGKACEIFNLDGRKILSGLHTMPYRPMFHCVPMYLGYYLNSSAYRVQILPMIQGAKVSSISKSEIRKTKLYIPSERRQQQIVNILYALDQRIDRAEKTLTALINMKSGLLQQLFI